MNVTQRDIDIWRVEAKELIRKMFEEWNKNYLGKRRKNGNSAVNGTGPAPTNY